MATQQKYSEDDAPCMKCTELVNKESKALQCDLCSEWAHIACVDVSGKAYSTLQTLKGSIWMCMTCQETLPSIPEEISIFKNEISTLRAQLSELSKLPSIVESVQQKLEALSQELESVKGGKKPLVSETKEEAQLPSPHDCTQPYHNYQQFCPAYVRK